MNLDEPRKRPACPRCRRKTNRLFVRANVSPSVRFPRHGTPPVTATVQDHCARCNAATVRTLFLWRTNLAGTLRRAIREYRVTFDPEGRAYHEPEDVTPAAAQGVPEQAEA
jgi:hypothetical protein